MKNLIVVIFSLLISACASAPTSSGASEFIQTVGVGSTYDTALKNGLNEAIQIKIGSVIVANQIVTNTDLIKDEIINYSSGYVKSYKVLDTSRIGGQVYLTMNVEVASSKIANRILSKQGYEKQIDGEKLHTQAKTFFDVKDNGKKLLNTVLTDFPVHAFNINSISQTLSTVDNSRVRFNVNYELKWNVNWLRALNEVTIQIKDTDRKTSNSLLAIVMDDKNNRVLTYENFLVYYFNDNYITRDIRQRLFEHRPYVKVSLYNGSRLIVEKCEMLRTHNTMYMYDYVYNNLSAMRFKTFESIKGSIGVIIAKGDMRIKNATSVNTEVVTKNKCPKGTKGF